MRKGADTAAVIASVLRTATQQGADPLAVLVGIQQSGDPPPQLDLAGAWAHHRDPRVVPCPGPRYRVVVTDEGDQGTQVAFDHTGDAFVVGVANLAGTPTVPTVTR